LVTVITAVVFELTPSIVATTASVPPIVTFGRLVVAQAPENTSPGATGVVVAVAVYV